MLKNKKQITKKFILSIFIFLFFSLFFGVKDVLAVADHYVRAGAIGNNDGTNWTDAWTTLPDELTRGDTYYIADGTYNGYAFDDDESGSLWIYIKKATESSHGLDNVNWNSLYGDGVVIFTCNSMDGSSGSGIRILRDYFDIDGVSGGGPGAWESGHGIKITLADANSAGIRIGTVTSPRSMTGIRLSHIEIDGGVTEPALVDGYGAGIVCSAGTTNVHIKSDMIFSHMYVHHIGGIHISLRQTIQDIIVQYSRFKINESSSTGAHGAGFRFECSNNVTVKYNWFSNMVGSAWVGFYGGPSVGACVSEYDHDNARIYGNIFSCDSSESRCGGSPGVISSLSTAGTPTVSGMVVYNNTFYNLISAGTDQQKQDIGRLFSMETSGGGNVFKNNLMYGFLNTELSTRSFTNVSLDYNAADYNFPGDANDQLLSSNPFTNSSGFDFTLIEATNPGIDLDPPYDIDMLDIERTNWNRGAFEFVSVGTDTTPPANPTGLLVK